ncbi:hypothetical protein HY991_01625 [Candidatus Micrarchaeota archaeon]|nr:hypothetical protein [Candidatus Micrarchaeota archaeon]
MKRKGPSGEANTGLHAVSLLIGVEHSRTPMGRKTFGLVKKTRFKKLCGMLSEARESGAEKLGVESAVAFPVNEYVFSRVRKGLEEPLSEKDYKTFATALLSFGREEGEVPGKRAQKWAFGTAKRFKTLKQFNESVKNGLFDVFEAVKALAYEMGYEIIPLETSVGRRQAVKVTERPLGQEERKQLLERMKSGKIGFAEGMRKAMGITLASNKEIVLDRNNQIVSKIHATKPDVVVVGELHAHGIADEVPHSRREYVGSWLAKVLARKFVEETKRERLSKKV